MFVLFLACILLPMKQILAENNCLPSKNGILYLDHDDSLTIPCFLNDNLDLNGTLYFTRDNDEPLPAKQINSSFISLNLEKEPTSRSEYACKYGDKVVCSNTIIVESKPVPATNLKCIFYNLRNLTCTWLCPKSFLKIDYNLTYYFSGSSHLRKPCLNLTSHKDDRHMSCTWMLDPQQQRESVKRGLNFEMIMANIFGTTAVKKSFLHYEHLLFGPPKELSCIQKTSNSLLLSWSVPEEARWLEFGVQNRIMYRAMSIEKDWKIIEIIESKTTDEIKNITFNLTNLNYVNSLYEVGISIRPISINNQDKLLWSENATITVKTMETIPKKPPTVDVGSFEIVFSTDETFDLFLYWLEVEHNDRNGENFTYYIESDDQTVASVETTQNYARFTNLNDTKDHIFYIWSKNNMGTSTEKAKIFVPKKSERINKPTGLTITPLLDREYDLEWKPSNISVLPVYSYTIFWCDDNQFYSQHCYGDLNWMQISGNTTTYTLILNNDSTNQFGISANTNSSSSGIVWNAYADFDNERADHSVYNDDDYSMESVPKRVSFKKASNFHPQFVHRKAISLLQPPDIKITIVTQTSITIVWRNSSSLSTFPTYYEIVCNNKSFVFTSNSTDSESFTITGLTSYADYTIYVRACVIQTMHCSEPSKKLRVTTQAGIPSAISHLYVLMQTESDTVVAWDQPKHPRGKNVFEVYYRKMGHRHPVSYYTEDNITCFEMNECHRNKTTSKFWITVRAVNFIDGKRFEGPWSEEFELCCSIPSTSLIWFLLPALIIFVLASLVALWCMYRHYQKKLYVDVILPSGLSQTNTDLKSWGRPSIDETALSSKFLNAINSTEENKNYTKMQLQPFFVNANANRMDLIAPDYKFEEVNENIPCLSNSNQPDLLEYVKVGTEDSAEEYVQMGIKNNRDEIEQSNYLPIGVESRNEEWEEGLNNKNSYTNLSDDGHRIDHSKMTNNKGLQQTISNGYIPIGTDLSLLGSSGGESLKRNSYEDLTKL